MQFIGCNIRFWNHFFLLSLSQRLDLFRHSSFQLYIPNIHIAEICFGVAHFFFWLLFFYVLSIASVRCVVFIIVAVVVVVEYFAFADFSRWLFSFILFSSYSTQNMNMMINLNLFISIWRMHTNVECWMYVFVYMERKMSTSFRDCLPLSFSVGCKNRNIKKPIQKRHIRRYTLSHRPLARLSIEMDFRYGEHCNIYIQWTHFKTDM